MRKRIMKIKTGLLFTLLALCISAGALGGCGKKAEDESAAERETESREESEEETEEETRERKRDKNVLDIVKRTEESETEETKEKKESKESKESEAKKETVEAVETRKVMDNNGGYFVKMSDGIYFHDYTADAFEEYALGGDFMSCMSVKNEENGAYVGKVECSPADTGGNTLCRYDESTGKVTRLFDDGCTGKLYWCGDRFYCDRVRRDGERVCTVSLDGTMNILGKGRVAAVSDDGQYIALWKYEGADLLEIYGNKGEMLYSIPYEDNSYVNFCGMSGGSAVYLYVKNGTALLCSNDGKTVTTIGAIPKECTYGMPEVKQFVTDGTGVYCVVAWYEGNMAALADYMIIRGEVGKQDSFSLIQQGYNQTLMRSVSEYEVPKIVVNNGNVSYVSMLPGEVGLSGSYYGSLLWYKAQSGSTTLVENFLPWMDRDRLRLQAAEVAGDSAYLLVASSERASGEDYGWRQSYRFLDMYYIRVPLSKSSTAQTITGPDWTKAVSFYSKGYTPFIGFWRQSAMDAGDGEREDPVEGSWIEFTKEQTAGISNDDYENTFKIGAYSGDDGCYIIGEGDNEDQLEAKIVDGELVITVTQNENSDKGTEYAVWTAYYKLTNS
ncbi:MAG: hypothetical protein K6E33_09965 [Lachnospiraceae bacterium]|nr:hypothetical protein [Lachnospiraceae bacterium]